jgi:cleavage and polyadenylation specificity factor subunit 1
MLGYGRRLIVLPFRRDPAPEDADLLLIPPSMQADVKPTAQQLMSGGVHSSKAPVLASYSIPLRDLDEKMDNVIDVQFLHGYYEPTLLILYEPVRTFPG